MPSSRREIYLHGSLVITPVHVIWLPPARTLPGYHPWLPPVSAYLAPTVSWLFPPSQVIIEAEDEYRRRGASRIGASANPIPNPNPNPNPNPIPNPNPNPNQVGAAVIGPRMGRFDGGGRTGKPVAIKGHSSVLQVPSP